MADTLSQALLEASLLSSIPEEDEGSVIIDVGRRTMVLPTGFFFGVYNDKDILKVPFVIPRYYNELDLSEFQITVNYINSAGYGNIYRVTDAEVTDSAIRFKWVTGRGVFVKEGTVRFIVCLRQIGSNGEVEKEFNTTIASANVLHGLEVDENPDPVAYSILAHMEELKDQAEAAVDVVEGVADRIDDAVTEAEQAIAAMYHSPYIAPTAADMLSHDKVYVYTGNETGYTFGNWYYWNGSAFVSGGIYNATAFETDATLTQSGKAADAKKTGDEISGLKEDLESIAIIKPSPNLYNPAACSPQDGKTYQISSGEAVDSTIGAITGKIPVEEQTQYIFSCDDLAPVKRAFYFSGADGSTFLTYETIDGAAFTTPSGCTFVGITFFSGSHTTEQFNAVLAVAQLELGDTATPYMPYGSKDVTFSIPATASDIDKTLSPKIVENGRVIEWQYVPVDGGGSSVVVDDTLTQSGEAADAKVVGDIFGEITELVHSKNLYDKTACNPQDGKWYGATTSGAIEDAEKYAITGKIPVEAGKQYTFSLGGLTNIKRIFYFGGDSGQTYISNDQYSGITSLTFTTPSQCTFVGFNLFAATHTTEQYNAVIDNCQLEVGAVVTDYVPYSETHKVPTDSLVEGYALRGAANTVIYTSLVNVYDKSKAVDGKYFNSTYNEIYTNANYAFSGLIPVKPNTQYCFSKDGSATPGDLTANYQEWDSSKSFIVQSSLGNATTKINQIHTSNTTHYISFNILFGGSHTTDQFNAVIDTIMVVEGTQRPAVYTPYDYEPVINHEKLDNMYQLNTDAFRGKKWLVTGTSVSYADSHPFTGGLHEGEVCRGYIGNVTRRKPMIVTNEGVSGSTLAGSDANSLINRYQNLGFGNYDFVTLEYGINDFGNNVVVGTASDSAGTGSFAACLKTIIEYIFTQNPTVGLIICTEPDVRGATTNNNGNTLKDYTDVTLEIARQYRLPVCDWYYLSGINVITKGSTSVDYMTADGTHPSNAGHMRMGAVLNQVFDNLLC